MNTKLSGNIPHQTWFAACPRTAVGDSDRDIARPGDS